MRCDAEPLLLAHNGATSAQGVPGRQNEWMPKAGAASSCVGTAQSRLGLGWPPVRPGRPLTADQHVAAHAGGGVALPWLRQLAAAVDCRPGQAVNVQAVHVVKHLRACASPANERTRLYSPAVPAPRPPPFSAAQSLAHQVHECAGPGFRRPRHPPARPSPQTGTAAARPRWPPGSHRAGRWAPAGFKERSEWLLGNMPASQPRPLWAQRLALPLGRCSYLGQRRVAVNTAATSKVP
jgi:hypothetical protein